MGISIRIIGSQPTISDIPDRQHQVGDAYVIDRVVYTYDGYSWIDIGQFQGQRGPQGLSGLDAYEMAVNKGFTGTFEDWVESLRGPQGDAGAGLTFLGILGDAEELPTTNNMNGDMYRKGPHLYVWVDTAWKNMGIVQGPRGDEGPEGPAGPEGPQGMRGPQGTAWLSFERDPDTLDGLKGDYAINTITNDYFLKVDEFLWVKLGRMGGGTVEEAPTSGGRYVRAEGGWKPLKEGVTEAPVNGEAYMRIDGTWTLYRPPIVDVETSTPHHRVKGSWVPVELTDAPVDDQTYFRRNKKWVPFNRYTLKNESVDTVMDLSIAQTFNIAATRDKALSFTNAPGADRTMTVVVTIAGDGGIITWPDSVFFKDEVPPTLGTNYTVVVMYWTGSIWIGKLMEAI
jgi:hypothetical protein